MCAGVCVRAQQVAAEGRSVKPTVSVTDEAEEWKGRGTFLPGETLHFLGWVGTRGSVSPCCDR